MQGARQENVLTKSGLVRNGDNLGTHIDNYGLDATAIVAVHHATQQLDAIPVCQTRFLI